MKHIEDSQFYDTEYFFSILGWDTLKSVKALGGFYILPDLSIRLNARRC